MKVHETKILFEYYAAICRGEKRFEIRNNDRDYQIGDIVVMRCWNPEKNEYYEKEHLVLLITYLLKDIDGIKKGYCAYGFKLIWKQFPFNPI